MEDLTQTLPPTKSKKGSNDDLYLSEIFENTGSDTLSLSSPMPLDIIKGKHLGMRSTMHPKMTMTNLTFTDSE
jgi:hypothetical protein